jgi:hypothetical protein
LSTYIGGKEGTRLRRESGIPYVTSHQELGQIESKNGTKKSTIGTKMKYNKKSDFPLSIRSRFVRGPFSSRFRFVSCPMSYLSGWAYQHGCEGHLLAKWYTVRAMLISTRFGCPSRIQTCLELFGRTQVLHRQTRVKGSNLRREFHRWRAVTVRRAFSLTLFGPPGSPQLRTRRSSPSEQSASKGYPNERLPASQGGTGYANPASGEYRRHSWI